MRTAILIVLICLCGFQTGCHSSKATSGTGKTWIAFIDNGDKPALAFQLEIKEGKAVSAIAYLLPPDSPRDLETGRAVPLKISKSNEFGVTCEAEWLEGKVDRFRIHYRESFPKSVVDAVLIDGEIENSPLWLTFRPANKRSNAK